MLNLSRPIRSIVVPVDFSDGCQHALSYAVTMAKTFDARLWVIHVGDFREHDAATSSSLQDVYHKVRAEKQAYARAKMKQLTEEILADVPELGVDSLFRSGTPHEAICKAAEELDADLIVMGTSGLSGLSRFMIGSTAERVVRASPVPVMTVRRPS